mgnify:CR=1 FL=1
MPNSATFFMPSFTKALPVESAICKIGIEIVFVQIIKNSAFAASIAFASFDKISAVSSHKALC